MKRLYILLVIILLGLAEMPGLANRLILTSDQNLSIVGSNSIHQKL